MKFKITCIHCGKEILFNESSKKPVRCSNCNFLIKDSKIIEVLNNKNKTNENLLDGLMLCCQKTGNKKNIKHSNRIVLGRDNIGKEILTNSHISSEHCVIECVNNEYIITDLNSTNGTFLGVDKIDCKFYPKQIIKDGDILYLGRESFLIKIKTKSLFPSEESNSDNNKKEETPVIKYRCINCDCIVNEKTETCPNCKTYHSLEIV
ncbi:MAG: FHA domain-containing protein [Candidatus Cloacimonetes bacterium]|nr:FHA domain-containing protein [Candidatus Cloacimonadota bacterium]